MSRGRIWEPVSIGGLALPNRLVMAAMGTAYCHPDGRVSDRLIRYLARRARGGVGLVVTEATAVDGSGAPFPGVARADEDHHVDGLARLAAAVHAEGGRVALQLYHAGRQMSERISGRRPVAPSAVASPSVRDVPRALDAEEVAALVERFAEAAGRAQRAGFDAIELNGGHGYLLHQFLSPVANRRDDDWGGDAARRMAFPAAVVERIRERVGAGMPILYKLSAEDHVPGGLTLDDTIPAGHRLVEAGADALVVSAGTYDSFDWIVQPTLRPAGCLRHYAAAFKRAIAVPIVAVGRVVTAAHAEEILDRGEADLVAIGRALLADPDLPVKSSTGHTDDIIPCIGCNECLRRLFLVEPIRCAVNPETGAEGDFPPRPADRPRRVLVIGGGPAGMEASLIARQRGHSVTLVEGQLHLGGRFRLADRAPHKREMGALTAYLSRAVASAGVEIRLGERVTVETVKRLAPEAVIVAAGGRAVLPDIPRESTIAVITAEQCLEGDSPRAAAPGAPAVVVGGDGVACDVALVLAERGFAVTVLTPGAHLAAHVESVTRRALLATLASRGVTIHVAATAERVNPGGVIYRDASGTATASAALVVLVPVIEPDTTLARALEAEGIRVHAVGDSARPGGVASAIHDAARAALAL
jgi:2,4-dienoyl-CoA reductase-like NADH-dependent reductase (Old Yellow Enzyme family)/thioredoxin reductase